MKTTLMLYPTKAECQMAFDRIILGSNDVKNFNRHELWVQSAIAKIYLMGATFPEKLLHMKFDGVWVDDRVDVTKTIFHFRSLEELLLSRMNDGADPWNYLSRGSSQLTEKNL